MICFIFIFPLVLSVCCDNSDIISHFSKDPLTPLCDVTVRIELGCSEEVGKSRSLVTCVSDCGLAESCTGASLNENGICFLHKKCPSLTNCTVENTNHQFFTKVCENGKWDALTESCKCDDGFQGQYCKLRYSRCHDLIAAGYSSGTYRVLLDPNQDGLKPFPVICFVKTDVAQPYASILLLNSYGIYDFNLTWQEYANGFYFDDKNYFAGLQVWHELSEIGCDELRFGFYLQKSPLPRIRRIYLGFRLSGPEMKYSFTHQSSKNSSINSFANVAYFGDCLGPLQNVQFSTWDSDNDGNASENCAKRAGSGWWYIGCDNPCNAFGFGLPFLSVKPKHQLFSVIGLDMETVANETGSFKMFLHCH